ncbi:hypothetical protein CL616_03915 [archaeon]|nr:hypothetical protein [archaeon]
MKTKILLIFLTVFLVGCTPITPLEECSGGKSLMFDGEFYVVIAESYDVYNLQEIAQNLGYEANMDDENIAGSYDIEEFTEKTSFETVPQDEEIIKIKEFSIKLGPTGENVKVYAPSLTIIDRPNENEKYSISIYNTMEEDLNQVIKYNIEGSGSINDRTIKQNFEEMLGSLELDTNMLANSDLACTSLVLHFA